MSDINRFHADLTKEQYEQGFIMSDTPTPKSKIESAYNEMIRDVQMSGEMIAYAIKEEALELERELTAAREGLKDAIEQRDDFRKEVEIVNERLRGKRHPDDNGIMVDGEIDIEQLIKQRDRLEEALIGFMRFCWINTTGNTPAESYPSPLAKKGITALQSLNQNETSAAAGSNRKDHE